MTAAAPGYTTGQLSVSVTQNLISTPGALTVAFGATNSLPVTSDESGAARRSDVVGGQCESGSDRSGHADDHRAGGRAFSERFRCGLQIGSALVTVSNPQYSPSTTNVTSSAELNIVQASASFNNGLPPPLLTVRLESSGTPIAAQQTLTVNLTSANPACVSVPASASIPNGQVTTTFTPVYAERRRCPARPR